MILKYMVHLKLKGQQLNDIALTAKHLTYPINIGVMKVEQVVFYD